MATAEQIVSKARSFIGVKESPVNSNNVIFNTNYYGGPVSGPDYPWCCAFVWDIFRMCGASDLFCNGDKTAYCPSVKNWAKTNGLIVNKDEARKGDLILFDWNKDGIADHIGFVESYSDGEYVTIEGNTSVGNDSNGGEVMRRIRHMSQVCCIVRPRYSNDESQQSTNNVNNSEAWKGNKNFYLENSRVGVWQSAMNKGFDVNTLEVDNKFGAESQTFASIHLLWSGQRHNCITAIRWLRKILRDVYEFTRLPYDGYWDDYLTTCVKRFQKNRGLTVDGIVGLETTYWLLTGINK